MHRLLLTSALLLCFTQAHAETLPAGTLRLSPHSVAVAITGGYSMLTGPEGSRLLYVSGAWWLEHGGKRTLLPLEADSKAPRLRLSTGKLA